MPVTALEEVIMAIKVRKDIAGTLHTINHHEIWRTSRTVRRSWHADPGQQTLSAAARLPTLPASTGMMVSQEPRKL